MPFGGHQPSKQQQTGHAVPKLCALGTWSCLWCVNDFFVEISPMNISCILPCHGNDNFAPWFGNRNSVLEKKTKGFRFLRDGSQHRTEIRESAKERKKLLMNSTRILICSPCSQKTLGEGIMTLCALRNSISAESVIIEKRGVRIGGEIAYLPFSGLAKRCGLRAGPHCVRHRDPCRALRRIHQTQHLKTGIWRSRTL